MRNVETVKLDAISQAMGLRDKSYIANIYGIFLHSETIGKRNYWWLCDETVKRFKIKLPKSIDDYPGVKPGDIVRIHRFRLDDMTNEPYVTDPRNVLVWDSSKEKPDAHHTARRPTEDPSDDTRRKQLELHYASQRITPVTNMTNGNFYDVVGRIDRIINSNPSVHIQFEINDGHGKVDLNVYGITKEGDVDNHYNRAAQLKVSDYILVTNVRLRNGALHLSANLSLGKWIRKIDPMSTIGRVLLLEKLEHNINNNGSNPVINNDESSDQPVVRPVTTPISTQSQQSRSPHINQTDAEFPPYKMIESLIPQSDRYQFCNIAGWVVGKPWLNAFGHWIFRFADGSKPSFSTFNFGSNPIEDQPGEFQIIVYKPVKETDSSVHADTVSKLKEFDCVYIKNIKCKWEQGLLKMELAANTLHGKSIEVVDRYSKFGYHIYRLYVGNDDDIPNVSTSSASQ